MEALKSVMVKVPLRIGLAGGGTDKPEYYKKHGPGAVISGAIDSCIYVQVARNFFPEHMRVAYSKTEDRVEKVDDIQHPVVREVVRYLSPPWGTQLVSITEVPSRGTGLGSSSSFTVGVLHAVHTLKHEKPTPMQLAAEAVLIERSVLREAGGIQDQYMAALGGMQYMEVGSNGNVTAQAVDVTGGQLRELEAHLMLLWTGMERSSSAVHSEQSREAENHIDSYNKMRNHARLMRKAITERDMREVGAILDETWSLKRGLANGISNPEIDIWYAKAKAAGALGGKITGAGGGGFLLLMVEPSNRKAVRSALPQLREWPFEFVSDGSKIVYEERVPNYAQLRNEE